MLQLAERSGSEDLNAMLALTYNHIRV